MTALEREKEERGIEGDTEFERKFEIKYDYHLFVRLQLSVTKFTKVVNEVLLDF